MGELAAYFVIIRGPLGVGKSSVATRLANRLGGRCISIDQILEERELWRSGSVFEFLAANKFAAQTARDSLAEGVPVVFDGNFYWKTQIADLVDRLDYPYYVFTLRAPLSVCIERDSKRKNPHGTQAARAVYAKSTAFEWGIGIDANLPVAAVVAKIVSYLRKARPLRESRSVR